MEETENTIEEQGAAGQAAGAPIDRRVLLAGFVLVTISAVSWGFSGVCVQFLTQGYGVDVRFINPVRMIATMVALLPVVLVRRPLRAEARQLFSSRRDTIWLLLYAVCGALACQVGYLFLISYTDAGTGTMLEQLGLIIVVAVGCLQAHRRPALRELLALVLALLGTFFLCTQGDLGHFELPPEAVPWAFFAAISMATYILLPAELLKRYSTMTVTALAMTVASVVGTIIMRPWECAPELSMPVVLGLAGTAVMGTIVAYIAFLEGIKRTGPIIGGLLDSLEPAAALVISVIWLATPTTVYDALGCVLIMGMMVVVALPNKRAKASGEPAAQDAPTEPDLRPED